jgi:two-component system chemotaxis response regulator CheY
MKRVLIVDDSAFMRKNLSEILTRAGFEVIGEADDGIAAIEKFKNLRPDVISLDITMPKMDGLETLRKIKEIDGNVKAVMCSSMGQPYYKQEASRLGAVDFIIKPFQPLAVIQTFQKILTEIVNER